MSKKDFEQIKPAIEAIPKEAVMLPKIPIDSFIQEAYDLFVFAKADVADLKKAGLDDELLLGLGIRIRTLQYLQALWNSERQLDNETSIAWEEMLTRAKLLRSELKHAFRFAFRGEDLLLNKLKKVNRGKSYADLIQDLSDLAVLGNSNVSKLKTIGFDTQKLKLAADLCPQLAGVLGKKKALAATRETKSLRDRAYTLLYVSIGELRAAARYAFRGQPTRIRSYRHRYLSRKKSRQEHQPT